MLYAMIFVVNVNHWRGRQSLTQFTLIVPQTVHSNDLFYIHEMKKIPNNQTNKVLIPAGFDLKEYR